MADNFIIDINKQIDYSGCEKGLHPFKVIHRQGQGYDTELVVRWCPKCGAVVVDMDYDNRTNPGYYSKIKYPEITQKYGFEDYNAKVTRYLFVYSNGGEDRIHISEEVSSFADAVVELMNAVGDNCDLFMKSLKGMDSVQDIVDLFNHFSMYSIHSYYMVGDING